MHIPDHVLDPSTCIGTGVAAAAAVGYSVHRVRGDWRTCSAPVTAATAACLFAAQMLNFPVSGGTSGHMVGGVLAGVVLGPWAGMLTICVVLLSQALLFQDGGLMALGANVLNMAVIGAGAGFVIYDMVSRRLAGWQGQLLGVTFASWGSIVLAAALCSLQLSSGGSFRLAPTLAAMLPAHAVIGLGEALITALAVACLLSIRSELIYNLRKHESRVASTNELWKPGVVFARFMAALLSPFASSLPDGLEAALHEIAPLVGGGAAAWSPLANYQIAGLQEFAFAGPVAGVIGTLFVLAVSLLLYNRLLASRCPAPAPVDDRLEKA